MAEGVQMLQWGQTSSVLAMLANANRDPKKKPSPFRPEDFNPWAGRERRRKRAAVKGGIEMLKVFVIDKEKRT